MKTARLGVQRRQKHLKMSGFLTLAQAFYLLQLFVLVNCRQFDIQKRFTKSQVCKETMSTIEKVDNCPSNDSSLQMRIQIKQCEKVHHSSCSDEIFVYHCVRFQENLVEVCAPRGLITGGCCAQFNEGVGRVIEDYNVLCSECPLNYFTNETCKYPTCVQSTLKANKTTKFSLQDDQPITQVPKSNASETGKIDCDTFARSKRHVKCTLRRLKTLTETTESTILSSSSESNERNKTRQNTTMASVIFISFGVLGIVFTLLILLYCCRKRLSWSCNASKKIFVEKNEENGKTYVQRITECDGIAIPENEIHDVLLQNRSSSTDPT